MNDLKIKINTLFLQIKKRKDFSIFCGLAIIALLSQLWTSSPTPQESETAVPEETYDTYIPEGFSLVPIEVANAESLDALLGDFGVVDLFTVPTPSQPQPQRVAYKIKIMRAPKNPQHFAVLVAFKDVPRLMKATGPFTVSVLNPKSQGAVVESEKQKKISRIGFNL